MPSAPSPLPPLAQELPHGLFVEPEQGVLLLQTRRTPVLKPRLALGCAWACTPVNIDVMDESACLSLARQYESLLTGLPLGSTLQIGMLILPSTHAAAWDSARAADAVHPLVEAHRALVATGMPHGTGTQRGRLRTFPTFVSVRMPLVPDDASLVPALQTVLNLPEHYGASALGALRQHLRASQEAFAGMSAGVEDVLQGCGHRLHRLSAEPLGQTVAQALDPFGDAKVLIEPTLPLGQQIFAGEAETIAGGWRYGWRDERGRFEETHRHQVLSLHHLPLETYPGLLSASRTPVGEDGKPLRPVAFWRASDAPLAVVVNMACVSPLQEERRLRWKAQTAKIQALLRIENATIMEELDKLLKQMFLSGATVHWARVHVVVWGQAATLARSVAQVQQAARTWRMDVRPEPGLGSTLFLQTLPLGCDTGWPLPTVIQRERRMPIQNLMHFPPWFGSTRGTKTATILCLNERGEEVGFDPFDSDTNAHMLISGTSGAGKTYTTAYIMEQVVSRGGIGIVLDPLSNYRALTVALHGAYYRLGFRNPPRINPFFGPLDHEHRAFLVAVLGEMASGAGEGLAWNAFNVLSMALAHHAKTWDPMQGETWLSRFVHDTLDTGVFAPHDPQAQQLGKALALNLSVFYDDGIFAPFVDGPNTFTLHETLTCVELSELDRHKELQGILFFTLLHLITQFYRSGERRLARKYLVGDEVWSPLKHAKSGEVIERIIRTFRNIRTSAIFCSNQAEDFASAVGKVVANLTDTKLILKQAESEIPDITRIFNLSAAEVQCVRQAQKYDGWSTAYLRLDKQQGGLVRLISNPLFDALVSQDPDAVQRRDHFIAAADGDFDAGIHALVASFQEGA